VTLAQKNAALKTWIMAVTGYDTNHVILRSAGGPRPDGEYAVFDKPYSVGQVGTAFVSEDSAADGEITRVHTANSTARTAVDIYAEDGAEVLEDLELSVEFSVYRGALEAGDLTFLRRTAVIYVPQYDDTDPRDRYRADFYFYTQHDLTETDFELQKVTAEIDFKRTETDTLTAQMSVGEIETTEE